LIAIITDLNNNENNFQTCGLHIAIDIKIKIIYV